MTAIRKSPSTFIAASDLSARQHRFVKLGATAGQVDLCGAGEATFGVLGNKPASGKAAEVAFGAGCTEKLMVDGGAGAIAIGNYLKSDALGRGVKSVANLEKVGAIALSASTATGDIIEVALLPPGTERSI